MDIAIFTSTNMYLPNRRLTKYQNDKTENIFLPLRISEGIRKKLLSLL